MPKLFLADEGSIIATLRPRNYSTEYRQSHFCFTISFEQYLRWAEVRSVHFFFSEPVIGVDILYQVGIALGSSDELTSEKMGGMLDPLLYPTV